MKQVATLDLWGRSSSIFRAACSPKSLWVLGGQAGSAVGLLLGLRLQTEFIAPETFGAVQLLVGYGALCVGVVCTPYLQGALRFFPETSVHDAGRGLKRHIEGLIARRLLFAILLTLAAGGLYCSLRHVSYWVVPVLCALCATDVGRSIELAFLNAARQQRSYSLWTLYEAWARPVLAVICVEWLGARPQDILLGYLVASAAALLLFHVAARRLRHKPAIESISEDTKSAIARYAAPLVPLGLVGWLALLSDRYVVGALLGLREAGIYAAVAGLIGRPYLMLQNAIELAARPVYFDAVASGQRSREISVHRSWMGLTIGAGLALSILILAVREPIVELLLGKRYSDGLLLIPFVAVSQLFLAVAYSLYAYLYAHKRTPLILLLNTFAALLTVALLATGGVLWGLVGIAAAGAIANLAQLCTLVFNVHIAQRRRLAC